MITKIIITLFFVASTLMADKMITVSAKINRADYKDKSFEHLKEMALQSAKLEAASQLFGDFIKSETVVKDGSLVKDLILAKQGGIVHIKGAPKFTNGKQLGELEVTIEAYATDEDIKDMQIQKIELTNFVYSNNKLPVKQLKQAAKGAFVLEAMSQKKPSLKTAKDGVAQAKALAVSVNIESMNFNADWMAYKMSGYVEYIPIFVRNNSKSEKKSSLKMIKDKAKAYIYDMNGGLKIFTLKYKNQHLIFDKKFMSFIKKKHKTSDLHINVNTKLLIPEEIKGDSVTIQANGKTAESYNSSHVWYETKINGKEVKSNDTLSVDVINDSGIRYVNLSINIKVDGEFYFQEFNNAINELQRLNLKILNEEDEEKDMISFLFKDENNGATANMYIMQGSGVYKKMTIKGDRNGFIFNHKNIKYINKKEKNDYIFININTKLLIPEEIKGDSVTIQANGKTSESYNSSHVWYETKINGKEVKSNDTLSVDVINDSGIRYVNLSINIEVDSEFYFSEFLHGPVRELSRLQFVAVNENEDDKKYAMKQNKPQIVKKIKAVIETEDSTKQILISHDGIGLIFNKKTLSYIYKKQQHNTMKVRITYKLLIPEKIKGSNVTIQANGKTSESYNSRHVWYETKINGKEIKNNDTLFVDVINNSGTRYVNLSIDIKIDDQFYFSEFLYGPAREISRLSFVCLDKKGSAYYLKIGKQ